MTSGFCVLIEQLHVVELSIERDHHFKHHSTIFIEDVLFKTGATLMASRVRMHDVVDDLSNLLLVLLQHFYLALHQLSLAVHERLRDHVYVLSLEELLSHLIQKCVHFFVCRTLLHFFDRLGFALVALAHMLVKHL